MYISIKNNQIEHVNHLEGHGKAKIGLERLLDLFDQITPEDHSTQMDKVRLAAEELYANFNRKLGWSGRLIQQIRRFFGHGDRYIEKVDALFRALQPIYVHTYKVGYNKNETLVVPKHFFRGISFLNEPVTIEWNSNAKKKIKECEKQWEIEDRHPSHSRFIFIESRFFNGRRPSALFEFKDHLPLKIISNCTFILFGKSNDQLNHFKQTYPLNDFFGIINSKLFTTDSEPQKFQIINNSLSQKKELRS